MCIGDTVSQLVMDLNCLESSMRMDAYGHNLRCNADAEAGKCADIPLIDNIIKISMKMIVSFHSVSF